MPRWRISSDDERRRSPAGAIATLAVALLALAMIWVAIVRVPLIRTPKRTSIAISPSTDSHSSTRRRDIPLAFPRHAVHGHSAHPLALPRTLLFGANATTLVSGGLVAYELVVLSVFLLGWRAFGPRVAAWSLVPLAFASVGTLWLSGRVTGGHLLTVAWFAAALLWLHNSLERGGWLRTGWLGLWLGFGFYLDQMTLSATVAIVFSALIWGGWRGPWWRLAIFPFIFILGFAIGDVPREVGFACDRYDAYPGQFDTIFLPVAGSRLPPKLDLPRTLQLAQHHFALLATECLPRLLAGHKLPSFATDPAPHKSVQPKSGLIDHRARGGRHAAHGLLPFVRRSRDDLGQLRFGPTGGIGG